MKKQNKQPNLQEHSFAMKVAWGTPQRDAYIEVFGVDGEGTQGDAGAMTPKEINLIDSRASRLAAREDIAALIVDERKLKGQRISARERELAERIRQNIGEAVLKQQDRGNTLETEVLKGAELFLKSTGQFAPEQHILKNGGMTEDALVPKGVENMDREELEKIISAERSSAVNAEAIDVESKEVEA